MKDYPKLYIKRAKTQKKRFSNQKAYSKIHFVPQSSLGDRLIE